jgi:hypothetical protein
MPPPEMKKISFKRPSLMELHSLAEDFSKAMIPADLLKVLKDESREANVCITLLPQFGFLYVATNSKVHQYDPNILEFKDYPFQITKNIDTIEISQALEDARFVEGGKNILFRFGSCSDESMEQAKIVAKKVEGLLGYEIQVAE